MTSLLPKIFPRDNGGHYTDLEQSLIRDEAKIGGALFGPVPKGRKREFFCLDRYAWIWREEWVDKQGHRKILTTKYDMQSDPDGVLKMQDGQARQRLSREEARNLYRAIELYCQRVGAEYRRMLQTA